MDQAYYNEAFRTLIKSAVTAAMISMSLLMLGTPIWKSVIVFAIVVLIHRANLGRRFMEGVALVSTVAAVTLWVEVLPSKEIALEKIAALRLLM